MRSLAIQLYVHMMLLKQSFLEEERGDVNIVSIVVLIGIAIVLAVLFRTRIQGLLETLFGSIESGAQQAIQPT